MLPFVVVMLHIKLSQSAVAAVRLPAGKLPHVIITFTVASACVTEHRWVKEELTDSKVTGLVCDPVFQWVLYRHIALNYHCGISNSLVSSLSVEEVIFFMIIYIYFKFFVVVVVWMLRTVFSNQFFDFLFSIGVAAKSKKLGFLCWQVALVIPVFQWGCECWSFLLIQHFIENHLDYVYGFWACDNFNSWVIKWDLEALEEGFCLGSCQEDYASVQWSHRSSNSFGQNALPSGFNFDFRSPHLLLDSGQLLCGFCARLRKWNKFTVHFWPRISSNYLLWERDFCSTRFGVWAKNGKWDVWRVIFQSQSVIRLCWQLDVIIHVLARDGTCFLRQYCFKYLS